MEREGQAETQPSAGVTSLDDIMEMDAGEDAPEELADSEEADESEGVESEVEEGDDESAGPEKLKFTIKHDGKDVELELTPDEHAEMLQKSFDYSKKTMAVAEERKAVETAKARADEYRQHAEMALSEQIGKLQALEQFLQAQIGEPPPVELAQQDVAYYLAQRQQHDDRKGQLEQARQAIAHLQSDQQRQRQAWIAQQADETEKALRDTLPGWNDNTLNDLAKYLEGFGLTPRSADLAFVQKGLWELASKAKAYEGLLAKKAEMKPVAQLPKVAKPGTQNQPPQLAKRQEAMKRHKAAPSLNSLADLL